MTLRVLVVDDSNFFQHRLKDMLNEFPDLQVVGLASNGREAIEKARLLQPDVITMDYEMPVMDGVTAVREIMHERPVPILMFSSLTYEGARITLDALEAGAVDFLPKNFSEISSNSAQLKKKLHDRLLAIARSRPSIDRGAPSSAALRSGVTATAPKVESSGLQRSLKGRVKLLMIGASTGGPVALAEVLTRLPANFPVPIVLIQHMPPNFTRPFAERLDKICQLEVLEAKHGDVLKPGRALLAPGGKQLMVDRSGSVKIMDGDERVNYKPCVDITFGSGANAYTERAMGLLLTGMGSDGCEGARLIKQNGGVVWSQDEASSVIYGMPMAVARAKLTDKVLGLSDISATLVKEL